MGNTTSTTIAGISALESIRDDAMQRLTNISLELMKIEMKLVHRDILSNEETKNLLKTRTELNRNRKLLKSNMDMANKGLLMIHQNEFDKVCDKNEKISKVLLKPFSIQEKLYDEEIDAFMVSFISS